MISLKLNTTGSFNPDYGITEEDRDSLSAIVNDLRSDIVQTDRVLYQSGEIPSEKKPLDSRFLWLPEEILKAYEQERERSELGRIFKVANSIHDEIDAVAVLGIGGSYMGARAMMEACCDPYHNELSRGARGSKPRMYFEGNNVDNDATVSLLQRLALGGAGETLAEKRHAIVVISKSGGTMETAVAFRQFLGALEDSLGSDALDLLRRLVIPVTGSGGKLHDLASEIDCDEVFSVPDGVGGRFSVLSCGVCFRLLYWGLIAFDCSRVQWL